MKRKNTLLRGYKMDKGGLFKPFSNSTATGIGAGATIADGALDLISPTDKFGTRSGAGAAASGALKGAAAGASLGPAGMIGGALIGGFASVLGNKKAQREKQNYLTESSTEAAAARDRMVDTRIANNPELLYGNVNASMYSKKYGGTVKGMPAKKFSLAMNIKRSAGQAPDLIPNVAISPGKMVKRADGGSIVPTSSTTAVIKGPKHEDGGVKLPEVGVEVEGGESITDDFVFSDKLGFAEIHERLGKRMGKNEKRPYTPLNQQTAEAMKRKEGFLKIYQEMTKKAQGIPNEIDSTIAQTKVDQASSDVVMRNGGSLPKMQDGGGSKLKALLPVNDPRRKAIEAEEAKKKARLAELTKFKPGLKPAVAVQDKTRIEKPILRPLAQPIMLPEVTVTAKAIPKGVKSPIDIKAPEIPGSDLYSQITAKYAPKVRELEMKPEGEKKSGKKINAGEVIDAVAPFASNIANAFRRLPKPPKPTMDDTLTPDLINLDASRAEAVRQRRGADKVAAANLNGNNAVAATKAANLTGQVRAMNEINQNESNINAGIKNDFQKVNADIRRGNNLKTDYYNQQQTERRIKQQSLDAENIADVGNKQQLIKRDKAMAALEDDKMILTIAQDNTGASIRAGDAVLKRRLSQEGYAQMKALGVQMEKANAEDRALLMAQAKAILDNTKANTNTILADSKAKKAQETSALNAAKTTKLIDSYNNSKK